MSVSAGTKNDRDYRKEVVTKDIVKVTLKIAAEKGPGAWNCYEPVPPDFYVEYEMKVAEFAKKFASLLRAHPNLNKDACGQYSGDAPVFAVILGQDPKRFRGSGTERQRRISHYPDHIRVREICDGKLVQVSIGILDSDEHYFFRVVGDELKFIPFAKECGVHTTERKQYAFAPGFGVDQGDVMWPWVALYPEKFAGLSEFSRILEPGDENPLTGLISAKDAPVRTLAKQVAAKLQHSRDQWARDIVSNL